MDIIIQLFEYVQKIKACNGRQEISDCLKEMRQSIKGNPTDIAFDFQAEVRDFFKGGFK